MAEDMARRSVMALGELSDSGEASGSSVRFDQNTNPRPNPVLRRWGLPEDLRTYGDPQNRHLRSALARLRRASPENVVVGNGSDEVLELVFRAFVEEGDAVAYWTPTFEMYRFLAQVHGGRRVEVPLEAPFEPRPDDLLVAKAKLILVASPNNPTGASVPPEVLERLAAEAPGLLLVDGAYTEFSGEDHWRVLESYPNVVVLGTLSKAYGLAGLRVGYGLAPPGVASLLRRVRGPYSLNPLAELIAAEALEDAAFVGSSVEMVLEERPRLAEGLTGLNFVVYPSRANFLLCEPPVPAAALAKALLAEGIAVRSYPEDAQLGSCLRITVGLPAENTLLLKTLDTILGAWK